MVATTTSFGDHTTVAAFDEEANDIRATEEPAESLLALPPAESNGPFSWFS
jgi:hypothetical protein